MLIQFLRGIQPGVAFSLGLFFLLAWIIGAPELFSSSTLVLGVKIPTLITTVVNASLYVGIGLWINAQIIEYQILNRSQSFGFAFFLLLMSGHPSLTISLKYGICMYALLFALGNLYRSYYQTFPSISIFNASLGISLAMAIAPEVWPFFLTVPFTMISFGHVQWRLWVLWLLGAASIYFVLFVFKLDVFITDYSFSESILSGLIEGTFVSSLASLEIVLLLFVMIVFIWSLVELIFNLSKKKIFNRKLFQIQIVLAFFALLCFLLSPSENLMALSLLAIPSSILIANWFHYFLSDRWANICLATWIVLIISSAFFH